jgi:hypothetical protein
LVLTEAHREDKVMKRPKRFFFLDIEASAIDGYPIEVGWAILPACFDGDPSDLIQSDAVLIRPPQAWIDNEAYPWDPQAEALHGISLGDLMSKGLPISECCQTLEGALAEKAVWCNSKTADRDWLEILFAEHTNSMRMPIRLRYWEDLFHQYWEDHEPPMQAVREALRSLPTYHRARLDAIRCALVFSAAWEAAGYNR